MILTYRMWRFVRIEAQVIAKKKFFPKDKKLTDIDCGKEFMRLKTLFRRRNYTPHEAIVALSMAIDYGYLLGEGRLIGDGAQEVSITGKGIAFSTPSGLVDGVAKSIAAFTSLVSVLISLFALGVSIYAAHQPTPQPKVVVIQSAATGSLTHTPSH